MLFSEISAPNLIEIVKMPLTHTKVKLAKAREKTYRLSDEKGLYLEISPRGSKYWRLKYRYAGKEKRLAIGVYPDVSLKQAREARDNAKQLLRDNVDPSAAKQAQKTSRSNLVINSFESTAREWFINRMVDKTEGHKTKVLRSMEKDLFPDLGHLPIFEIDAPTLLKTLRKIEGRGAIETAHRVKQTAGQIFRYGIATGRCMRDPSADLKGALQSFSTKHFSALTNPKDVKNLLIAIDTYQGTPTVMNALKLAPILFVRPGELRQMEWLEINWENKRWELPAEKMKLRRPHIVPLAHQTITILEHQHRLTGGERYVFPSARGKSRPLSDNALRMALRTLGYAKDTMSIHGFRAVARTLLDEELGFKIEWIEQQLAHAVKDPTGRAYNRTTHLPQRIKMMQEWVDYLDRLKNDTAKYSSHRT